MILEAKNIQKRYRQGKNDISVLNNLNLTLKPREKLAILGKSGSGKSTLLSLISGLDYPDSGYLKILGKNIFDMNENQMTKFRGRHLGIIFQHFHLIPHLTALENISLPLEILGEKNAKKKGMELLNKVGLNNRRSHLPIQLSGGEMQRIAVARALSTSPDVILADEPSGSLDDNNAREIIDLIFSLVDQEEKALILVTHDLELSQRCQRRLNLKDGFLSEVN
ncbi:MAG: ABC transporter ATP-binding protein [Bdellovibrionales bacterium]|nr:ABC transporter ATP-binding protein [Bdellovibrionales bacterium]